MKPHTKHFNRFLPTVAPDVTTPRTSNNHLPRKICIITPGTIANNPRVVKEAEALSEAGYRVHLVYTRHIDYLVERDNIILNEHPAWTADYLDWASSKFRSKTAKLFSGIKRKLVGLLVKTNLYPDKLASILINRFYYWQLRKAIASKADLYIAHYPDSLGVAFQAAKVNNALFAYDAEDYHRGEDLPQEILKIIQKSEDFLLPSSNYISASSPLIAKEYLRLYTKVPVVTIENMFPVKNQPVFQKSVHTTFKFFWFSQKIGSNRGLEEFISILGNIHNKDVQLSLLGNVSDEYREKLINLWDKVNLKAGRLIFFDTVTEKEIFMIASDHHFGLALETQHSYNRDICLTNKLYTYILSGNFLILNDTKAQRKFNNTYPQSGICIELKNTQQSVEKINALLIKPEEVYQKRLSNYNLGQSKLNFDLKKLILIQQVSSLWP